MKKSFTLGTLLLGCCLAAVAQTNQMPPAASTPPTFPQDQTDQAPSNPAAPSNPSELPPDTNASGQTTPDYSSDAPNAPHGPAITARGCLDQAASGDFVLTDASGNNVRLHGDTALLATYIGDEVRVDGVSITGNAPSAGSMSSSTSSDSGASATSSTSTLAVTEIHKLSEACPAGQQR